MRPIRTIVLVVVACMLSAGCAEKMRNDQLEKVAKDWCNVIRASQVIPVYPLTEDLQPGDVLLVRTPIQDQHREYRERGYLPLDQHLVRLSPAGYGDFYNKGYLVTKDSILPRIWQFPDPKPKDGDTLFTSGPRAAFPTYKFSVNSGAGINAAIPVQAVPIGLSLLGASSADGSVTISDVYTYGLPDFDLRPIIEIWAREHRAYLQTFSQGEETVYLRVISRVYLTGGVNVVVNSDQSFGAKGTAGSERPVDLFATEQGDTAANYANVIDAMNTAVKDAAPGGTVKVAAASSRSVSLNEKFARPLVIGYLGFDLPIMKDGSLGGPIPTLANLQNRRVATAEAFPAEMIAQPTLLDAFQPLLDRFLFLQRDPTANRARIDKFHEAAKAQGFDNFGNAANAVTINKITVQQIDAMKAALRDELSAPPREGRINMAKKKKVGAAANFADTPMSKGATQVRVLQLPTDNIPMRVKQICDLMLTDSYRCCGSFVYDDHLVLIFQ